MPPLANECIDRTLDRKPQISIMEDNVHQTPNGTRASGDLRSTWPPSLGVSGGHTALASRRRVGSDESEFSGSPHRGLATVPVQTNAAMLATPVEWGTEDVLSDDTTSNTDARSSPLGSGVAHESKGRSTLKCQIPGRFSEIQPDECPLHESTVPNEGHGATQKRRKEGGQRPFVWIATFNIRGIKSSRTAEPEKTRRVPRIMKSERLGILALQETHETTAALSTLEDANEKMWCFPNPGTAHSAGTGFVVHRDNIPPGTKKEDLTHKVIVPGRADLLTLKWAGGQLTILNVYTPNGETDTINFFSDLVVDLRQRRIDVVMGDFNHMESKLDRLPKKQPSERMRKALSDLSRGLKVDDGWREDNPTTLNYTWTNSHKNRDGSTSRASLEQLKLGGLSDHQILALKIAEENPPYIGKPRWRMNLEDIEDGICMGAARLALLKAERQMKWGKDPMATWLNAKTEIKNTTSDRQTMRCKERGRHLHALEKDRKDLMSRPDFTKNQGVQDRALALEDRIQEVRKSKLDRVAEYSAARYASKGEAVNKYWFSIGKSIKEDATIRAL
ncbi:hypothetical protein M407DRAFT_23144 [Tulasnella calospora MUT 4182]|uniref:Endonuclease/exonuclease/phosphatase domain-containing protein n=1 Tax=Tulasnella calospora MUT 4182 TaxID=1051891 RepID=A0A0C3M1J5_9AGAM|nr:hypothetical protein M407DRAFT_23144 [Tulasnella calospora MUT 4182]